FERSEKSGWQNPKIPCGRIGLKSGTALTARAVFTLWKKRILRFAQNDNLVIIKRQTKTERHQPLRLLF
ncbi:MAG: hypothetical protein IKU10_05035, partial [Clostridia bacterium]|nr:hypothetical protein [Clostridia bacterium]